MSAEILEVTVVARRDRPGVLSVLVVGDVDQASALQLRHALAEAAGGKPDWIEVDLSRVTFFSRAGLVALLETKTATPGRLTLRGAGRPVRRLLQVLGLQDEFELR